LACSSVKKRRLASSAQFNAKAKLFAKDATSGTVAAGAAPASRNTTCKSASLA
jgi:hypothetical protein